MKTTLYSAALLMLLLCPPLQAVAPPVLKIAGTNALVEPLATGANSFTISPTGALVFSNGASLSGGTYLQAAMGLGNVQNIAISSWAGSSNLTTLGTITTGVWNGTAIPVANGGTGATTASTARSNLGLIIGSNVQAFSGVLSTYAGINPSANVQSLLGAADYAAMRSQLGLVIGTNVQAYDGDLTTWSTLSPSSNMRTFIACSAFSDMRSALGLIIGTNVQAYDADLTTYAGIPPTANVQSLLGAADYAAMRSQLGLVIGTNVQAYNSTLAALAGSSLTIDGSGNLQVNGTFGYTTPMLRLGAYNTGFSTIDGATRIDVVLGGAQIITIGTANSNYYTPLNVVSLGFDVFAGAQDITLLKGGTGNLWQRAGSQAQIYSVTNTYTSSSNYEAYVVDWQADTNICRVGTVKGSGGGTARAMIIQTDGTERIRISAGGEIFLTLPTSAGTSGSLWNDGGVVKVAP